MEFDVTKYGYNSSLVEVKSKLLIPKRGGDRGKLVGYEFVSSIDMEVPDNPLSDDCYNRKMSWETTAGVRVVKAGVPFCLTRFDTGLFVSKADMNGAVTGGEVSVKAVYSLSKAYQHEIIPTVTLVEDENSKKLGKKFIITENQDSYTLLEGEEYLKFRKYLDYLNKFKTRNNGSETRFAGRSAADAFLAIIGKKG